MDKITGDALGTAKPVANYARPVIQSPAELQGLLMQLEPNFFDPALQSEEPQRSILHFLRVLTPQFERVFPRDSAEDMALGALVRAKGVELENDTQRYHTSTGAPAKSIFVRLAVNGMRWKETLLAGEKIDAVKARGAVLTFVWQVSSQYVDEAAQCEATVPATRTYSSSPVASMPVAVETGEQANTGERPDGLRRLALPHTYPWERVLFVIIDDQNFKVRAGSIKVRLTIHDAGLIDRRNGSGNRTWTLLCRLADEPHALPGKGEDVSKKEVSELRRWLREFTGLMNENDDPFKPYVKGFGWRSRFKVMHTDFPSSGEKSPGGL